MKSAHWLLTFVLLAVVPGLGHAAVDCTAREPDLPHVCEKGPNAGQACVPDFGAVTDPLVCSVSRPSENDFCLGAKCTMVFEKGATFSAVMTMIADNNVSAFDGSQSIQNAIAVTVIIDLGKRGVLAQTYQNLSGTEPERPRRPRRATRSGSPSTSSAWRARPTAPSRRQGGDRERPPLPAAGRRARRRAAGDLQRHRHSRRDEGELGRV